MKRTALARRTPLRANRRRIKPLTSGKPVFQRAAQQQLACMNPRCPTPGAPWDPHHVIYKQHVRNHGGDQWDPRNAMRLCRDCHQTYHRMLNLPASILPPAALAFARDLLGENAGDYLNRYYPKENA